MESPKVVTSNPLFGVTNLSWAVRPNPLIDGFLPERGVVVIAAEPFTGKTFLALEMARSVIDPARPFLNKFKVTPRKRKVLFVEQDSADWDFRVQYEKITHQKIEFDPETFDGFDRDALAVSVKQIPWLHTDELVNDLAYWANHHEQFVGYARIFDEATGEEDEVEQYVTGFDIIILDSLAAMHTYDENQNQELHKVINRMRLLAMKTGACIVVLHHVNKGDAETRNVLSLSRLRGASSIGAAADVVIGLWKKHRYAEEIHAMMLKNRAFPEQRDVEYYVNTDEGTGDVVLSVDSLNAGTTSFRRSFVEMKLKDNKGWMLTNDLIAMLMLEEKAAQTEGKLRSYQNSMYKILGDLEREKLIERKRGEVKWVQTFAVDGFPEEE